MVLWREQQERIQDDRLLMSMETGATNVSKKFGVSAYQGGLAMEVLTCINNLQSRCDILGGASAVLGCASCCSCFECRSDELLLDNRLQRNYLYTKMLANAVDGHSFIGQIHRSSIKNNLSFLPSDVVSRQPTSVRYVKRLRMRPAGFPEEETAKKKGKPNHAERSLISLDTLLTFSISAQPQHDKEKLKAARSRKERGSLIFVKVEDKHLSKSPEPKIGEPDAKIAALESQRCVSLLKGCGVIGNPYAGIRETVDRCVSHPGCVGDGLLTKMCQICGMAEDANNTVICDGCQEAFHLLCCVPRLTSKYFKREDNWFCGSCRKQERKTGFKFAEKGSTQDDSVFKVAKNNESKARLGPAHQAYVPDWQERALEDDAERHVEGCMGMESCLSNERKDEERYNLLGDFNAKLESLCWLPADKIPSGISQNWVKCNNVIVRGYKTSDGKKQNEVVCGKWRRAPLNVMQTNEWECFCAIEWDPLHADCAIPQECSDEEVFRSIAGHLQVSKDLQGSEASGRKATLRNGKLALI